MGRFREIRPIGDFGTHGVAGLEFLSPWFGKPGTCGWVHFKNFDQNVIFVLDWVAGSELVSPRPARAETGDWVDFRKFDKKVIFGPHRVAYYHGLAKKTPAARSISGNSTKTLFLVPIGLVASNSLFHGLGSQKLAVGPISRNSTKP